MLTGFVSTRALHEARWAAFFGVLLAAPSAVAIQFDNDSGDMAWETAANWVDDALPGTFDPAELFGPQTINLSSAQSIGELQLGDSATLGVSPGITVLNLLPGSSLTLPVTNNRIGREVTPGNFGEAAGHLIISGGDFVSLGSVRMSYDKTNSADSLIEISAGSFRNESDRLHVGRDTRNFLSAEFRVVGSQATEIFTEDMRVRSSQVLAGSEAKVSFQIDAGGVTPIVVNDELNFVDAILDISLIDDYDPANGDIRLFDSGRLTGGVSNDGPENFANYLPNDSVTASTTNFDYEWTIDYIDDDPVDGGVYLRNLVRTAIGGGITGDYNASGQVEQGDLDLVLQNWGLDTDSAGVPAGWTNDLPSGQIEQTELDGVLSNWGAMSAPDFSGSAVPEPGGVMALIAVGGVMLRRRYA